MTICNYFSFTKKCSYCKTRCSEKNCANNTKYWVLNDIYGKCWLMLEFFNLIIDTSTYRLEKKVFFTCNSIKVLITYHLFVIQYCLKWLLLLNSFCANNSLYKALLTIFSFQKLWHFQGNTNLNPLSNLIWSQHYTHYSPEPETLVSPWQC